MHHQAQTLSQRQPTFKQRELPLWASCCLFLWSLLITIVFSLFNVLALVNGGVRRQMAGRLYLPRGLKQLAKKRRQANDCSLFFCSSAGEYEQAKPLIARLQKDPHHMVVIIFFSESGISFATKRNEKNAFFLSPPDSVWSWKKIFQTLDPSLTVIVRHELWPGFLSSAWQRTKVCLINACAPSSKQSGLLSRSIKMKLLRFVDFVFIIDSEDQVFFNGQLAIENQKIIAAGDTKFDRVKERLEETKDKRVAYRKTLDQLGPYKRLIVGSAWPLDYETVIDAYLKIKNDKADFAWQLVIALHQPTTEALEKLTDHCQKKNLCWTLYSNLESGNTGESQIDIIIVDKMGILSELYGCCELAFVGGALHYRVHNVLEPAIYGLGVAFGPLYHTSPEAVSMTEAKRAAVIRNSQECASWWIKNATRLEENHSEMLNYLGQFFGASDRIIDIVKNS